jgi:hypothetical protein
MTQFFVQIKQIGKRKAVVEKQAIGIPSTVCTLRQLLIYTVTERVETFNQKSEAGNWTKYLTDYNDQLNDINCTKVNHNKVDLEICAESGKVGFDANYNGKKQDIDKSVEVVLLAFEDGLFRVFAMIMSLLRLTIRFYLLMKTY